jgi:long-subunit acyl-CoA synthetase (AMP-forming)
MQKKYPCEENQKLKVYFSAPPRIYNAVYTEYKDACDLAVRERGAADRWRVELEMLDKFRNSFGSALEFLVTGSAPTSEVVKEFLRRCFAVPLYDGYGTTEGLISAIFLLFFEPCFSWRDCS